MMKRLAICVCLTAVGCAEVPAGPPPLTYAQRCERLGYKRGSELFLRCYTAEQADDTNRGAVMMGAITNRSPIIVRGPCSLNEIIAHSPGC